MYRKKEIRTYFLLFLYNFLCQLSPEVSGRGRLKLLCYQDCK
jgi:hypothetical protein